MEATPSLIVLLMDPTTSEQDFKAEFLRRQLWPDSVAAVQSAYEARRLAAQLLIFLMASASNLLPNALRNIQEAPGIDGLRVSLGRLLSRGLIRDSLLRCIHRAFPDANPALPLMRRLHLNFKNTQEILDIPEGIQTVEHLIEWIKASDDILEVDATTEINLTAKNGRDLQAGVLTENDIYCRLNADRSAKILKTALTAGWAIVVKTLGFCAYSLFRTLGGKQPLSVPTLEQDQTVLVFALGAFGVEAMFVLAIQCWLLTKRLLWLPAAGFVGGVLSFVSLFVPWCASIILVSVAAFFTAVHFISLCVRAGGKCVKFIQCGRTRVRQNAIN